MKPSTFEEICRKSRLKTFPKKFVKDHELYYAEGYRKADENMSEPHYKVLWAVSAGEKMDVAQEIFIPAVSTIDVRMNLAMRSAEEFIQTCKQVQRF